MSDDKVTPFTPSLDLINVEFMSQQVNIKVEQTTRRFLMREMTAERVIDYSEEWIAMNRKLIELTNQKSVLEDEAELRGIKTEIQKLSSEFLSKLLIPQDEYGPATSELLQKYVSYRHRSLMIEKQDELNSQAGVHEVSFTMLKGVAYELSKAVNGKIPQDQQPAINLANAIEKLSQAGSLLSSGSEGSSEA